MPSHPHTIVADENPHIRWAENEFYSLDVKDPRRVKRLKKMAADFHARPGQSIPQSSGSAGEAKGAYRLIEGGSIGWEDVLRAHADAASRRAS